MPLLPVLSDVVPPVNNRMIVLGMLVKLVFGPQSPWRQQQGSLSTSSLSDTCSGNTIAILSLGRCIEIIIGTYTQGGGGKFFVKKEPKNVALF